MSFSLYWAPRGVVVAACCPPVHTPASYIATQNNMVPSEAGLPWLVYSGAFVPGVVVKYSYDKIDTGSPITSANPPVLSVVGDLASGQQLNGALVVTKVVATKKPGEVGELEITLDFTNVQAGDLYWVRVENMPCGCCTGFNVEIPAV